MTRGKLAISARYIAAAVVIGLVAHAPAAAAPVIQTEDVARFYRIYDAAHGHPSAQVLQQDYLDRGSPGLHTFAKMRNITGARIAAEIAKRPAIYADAKRCMAVLPRVRTRVAAALAKLGRLYPQAKFPPVTIAVGRGKPVGVGSPAGGIMIGLEALCATTWLNPDIEDRFVFTIAHEYIHVQQSPALADDPHPTVLEVSLIEGAAEFLGKLISGGVSYTYFPALVKGREKSIEKAFVRDENSRDLSRWLYNSTPDHPQDLGYWVGYQIVKAYYDRARDKRAAIREIIRMNDPKAFLAKSGWRPGTK